MAISVYSMTSLELGVHTEEEKKRYGRYRCIDSNILNILCRFGIEMACLTYIKPENSA